MKNGVIFTIAPFLPKIVSIFLLPIMTGYLTDVDFGISGTISAYSQAIGAFSTLGLSVVLLNSFFKKPESYKEIWKEVYGFLNIWMILYALLQATVLYIFIPEEAAENKWWIIFLTNFSTVFFGPTAAIGNAYFIYTKQSVPIVWRSFLASIITILVNFYLIVYLRLGYMGWYVGSFAGIFFSNATYWFTINRELHLKPSYNLNIKHIRQYLNLSVPTIPHYYTGYLLEGSGRMVLDQYNMGQGEIGKISISQQLGTIYQAGVDGMNNAMSPYIMQYIKANEGKKIEKLAFVFISVIFLTGFAVSLWSKELFLVLIKNETLQTAYPYLIIIIMALCSRALYLVVSSFYFYHEDTKPLLFVSFGSGIIALVLYILLTPLLGIWGFLIGYYISHLYMGYSGYLVPCYKKKTIVRIPILIILSVHILLTVISYIVVDYLWVKIVISIIILIVLFVLFKNFIHVFKRK